MKQVPMHLRNPRRRKERGNDMTTHTRPRQTCAAWIAAFGMALVAANATAQSNTVPGRIIEINVPGSGTAAGQGTQAIGVNERGAIVGIIFVVLWRKGYLQQLTTYVQQTREELRKCTWPTWDELKGSTVVVTISIVILGGFVVLVDQAFFRIFMFFKL